MKTRCYITLNVPPETAAALEQEALERKTRISPLVRQIVNEHIERQQQLTQQRDTNVQRQS